MTEHLSNRLRRWFILLAAAAGLVLAATQGTVKADDLQLIQPGELAQTMKSSQKPVILYVGPNALFTQAHIPGSEYIGPTSKPQGLEKLRARAASLPKDGDVVIYCGCCPWNDCPNIRPAYAELKKIGFSRVRVLYLATSFGVDWKDKGLPVAAGE
jgi:rhodanese-related sulfurtransferase